LSHFNFLSLLNLPDILREFGTPRNYFEGKYLGERYVQEVKNVRKQCASVNVTESVLRKLHEGKALESVIASQSSRVKSYRMTEVRNEKKKQLTGNIRIYPSAEKALLAFHSKKPISVLQEDGGGFGILFYKNGSNRGEINFWKLERFEEVNSVHHGMRYWKWQLTDTILAFHDWEVKDFAVLLPKIGRVGEKGEYTMVTKEWSPAMLEHYDYSSVGIEEKKPDRVPVMRYSGGQWVVDGWDEGRGTNGGII
jgi:hypothetical protein